MRNGTYTASLPRRLHIATRAASTAANKSDTLARRMGEGKSKGACPFSILYHQLSSLVAARPHRVLCPSLN